MYDIIVLVVSMHDFVILTDTRQQKENHILKEFDKQNILHIRTTLPSADYMALRYSAEKGYYLDYRVLIDTKKDLEEIAGNLCNTQNHERIKREISRAKELGCEQFYFIIGIKADTDVASWQSSKTKVKGKTLLKIMNTMAQRYNVNFVLCEKKNIGKLITKYLQNL